MLERFLVLITLIFAAYEAKFPNDPIYYKGAIRQDSLSYFKTLCENGQTLIIQILDSILAGTFTNTLRSLGGNLVFKFGKKGGQLKSLFNLALKSFDSGSVVCLLKPKDLKVKMVEFVDTCRGDGEYSCCNDYGNCGIDRTGREKMMNIRDAYYVDTDRYTAGWTSMGGDIEDLTLLKENLLIFQVRRTMGTLVYNLIENKPLLPCFTKFALRVNGEVLMEPHHTCDARKLDITEYTTVCLNGVCGNSLIDTFLYRFWSNPQEDAGNGRALSRSRRQMLRTVMFSAYKSSEVLELLPDLEPELWMLVFTFIKHE